ncbi:MAG: pyruvate, phosphate dikinase [Chloroflexi bacterium]|nr:pyruvate, phosphate dikinase [Chloroflexota bacterium]
MTSKKSVGQRQWVFSFQRGDSSRKDLLGNKGAQLAEMTAMGLPVPPGFTITTEACLDYYRSNKRLPEGLWSQVLEALKELETASGRKFGDPDNPLLVSVRSGAAVSMPGMMDTILNLGINEGIADGIGRRTGNGHFALDIYRRFIQMFGSVVMNVKSDVLDVVMDEQRRKAGVGTGAELSPDDLREVIARLKLLVKKDARADIPDDPMTQLNQAIRAVFESWNSRRAIDYRNFNKISHDLGTAVSVVAMVFGNLDDNSCTGVLFTRDPSTGDKTLYGEYLTKAQGEDVVAGTATPRKIAELAKEKPDIHRELLQVTGLLEHHNRDAQDIEFTVEQGKLYMLQTRTAKRSAKAAIKIAVDMVQEGLITQEEGLLRVAPDQISQLLLPRLDERAKERAKSEGRLLGRGLGASPGGATGKVVFSADTAAELGKQGVRLILARPETKAEDVHGMLVAAGILTGRGGATSHAAVVARGLGKPCVAGAEGIEVNPEGGYLRRGDVIVKENEEISIDGSSGEVFVGSLPTILPNVSEERELAILLSWADSTRRLGVWANADYPRDAETAIAFGAEGIGLCRTEHMFFEPERLALVRTMILAAHASNQRPDDKLVKEEYHATLDELSRFQVSDFEGILRAMKDKPVVIRLLDPPLHEFLPSYEELLTEVVELRSNGSSPVTLREKEKMLASVGDLREANPMLGLRGCRLGLIYPDIYAMQVRAIVTAASNVMAEGIQVHPEIMIPLVGHRNEMRRMRALLEETIEKIQKGKADKVSYKIGTMIETPRAALTADEIAETAEFFSFGTNDLTQTTFAVSRDDAEGKFLMQYVEDKILPEDPFKVLDRKGVGRLVEMAYKLGKQTRPNLTVGICGEHGGDPSSIEFFHAVGLDYVSCSPYRVPIARLAAAQAALRSSANGGVLAIGD